jgi:hypothetical protein
MIIKKILYVIFTLSSSQHPQKLRYYIANKFFKIYRLISASHGIWRPLQSCFRIG